MSQVTGECQTHNDIRSHLLRCAADRFSHAEASERKDDDATASKPASGNWQPLDAADTAAKPAPVQTDTEVDPQDSSQLQSWNDELTQRLSAAMQKLPSLLPSKDEATTRSDRRQSAVS